MRNEPALPGWLNLYYSFTAPAETPVTRKLDNAKYRITIGTAIKTDPAANLVNCVSSRCISPTATVHRSLFFNNRLGRIKSLQGHANCVSAVYTMIGLDSGKVTLQNTLILVAPSILAAS